ncbi:MAG: LLM class F420-dependent oxidoreductase, partial [Chloroflexaceae bacterium]
NIIFVDPGQNEEQATAPVRALYNWSLEQTQRNFIVGTPQQVAEHLHALKEAGATYFITYFPRVAYDHTPLHIFAEEVVPLV